jgi:1-acyl-sn-glycerol-3-phosphate acyltransferase
MFLTNLFLIGARIFLKFYSLLLFRLSILWDAPLPPGPKLFVANHPSATDPFILHLVTQEQLSVLIIASAFSVPIFGALLRRVRQIAVHPERGGLAMEQALETLKEGHSVGIFPEGDFSPRDGSLRSPRSGAARLALSSGVPVIPVGIYLPRELSYTIRADIHGKPSVGYWYLHGPYAITVGKPLRFTGDVDDRQLVGRVSTAMMDEIRALARESERRARGLNSFHLLHALMVRLLAPLRKRLAAN